jgi:hypothetical protein
MHLFTAAMIVIPILSLICTTYICMKILQISAQIAPLIALSVIVFVMYIATIFGVLQSVVYVVYGTTIPISVVLWIKNKQKFSNAVETLLLLLTILAFYIYTRDAYLHAWDDFGFWAIFSKELLLRGYFENQDTASSLLISHIHYPRGPSLYHYFILILSGYSEGGVLFAHFILHLLCLAPLFKNKASWQSAVLVIAMLSVVTMYTTGVRSIYNDSTVGLMFSSVIVIYIILEDKLKAVLLAAPILALLVMFREVGFILALLSILFFLIEQYAVRSLDLSKIALLVVVILFVIGVKLIWLEYFDFMYDSFPRPEHSIANLIALFSDFDESKKLILRSFMSHFVAFLIKEGSIATYCILCCSYYGIVKYKPEVRSEFLRRILILLVLFCFFVLWRLYLYYFAYSNIEAVQAKSLLRYAGCFMLVFAYIGCVYIKQTIFTTSLSKVEATVLCVMTLVFGMQLAVTISRIPKTKSKSSELLRRNAATISQALHSKKNVVLHFDGKPGNLECHELNYLLAPTSYPVMRECVAFSSSNPNISNIDVDDGIIHCFPFLRNFNNIQR